MTEDDIKSKGAIIRQNCAEVVDIKMEKADNADILGYPILKD